MHTNHPHIQQPPRIAIIDANTLTGLGLAGLIERIFPVAEVTIFSCYEAMQEAGEDIYFHYFVSLRTLLEAPDFFGKHRHRTIVVTQGDTTLLPAGYHLLDASLPEEQLVKAFLKLEQHAHGDGKHLPQNIQQAVVDHRHTSPQLTPREADVLREIVRGYINKEIADHLHISLTTVISHRKNLIDKLGIRTVSGLTIYAVMHGLVRAEEI